MYFVFILTPINFEYCETDENISEQMARDEFERKRGILTRKVFILYTIIMVVYLDVGLYS